MADACRIQVLGTFPAPQSVGDASRIGAIFTNLDNGTEVDPDTVRFKSKVGSDGTETILVYGTDDALVREDTGIYHVDMDYDTNGVVFMRWECEGNFQGAV